MVVELAVDRVVAGGAGLAEHEGRKVFVPFAAPWERVRARLVSSKRDYAVARIEEVLEPSPVRVEPRCPLYGRCGGCQFQHISSEGQLVVKKLVLADALQRIGKVFTVVRNCAGSSEPWHYRNKTQYPLAEGPRPLVGFYRAGTHQVIDAPACLVHPPAFDRLRRDFVDALERSREPVYDERSHRGNVRHLIVRGTGRELLAIVVTRTGRLAPTLVESLAASPGVAGVVQNINPDRTNRILGPRFRVFAGRDYLEQRILGRRLRVSAPSFFQVNTAAAEALCRKVLKHLAPTGAEHVLDLFSGVGMLTLAVAGFVRRVTGIELDPDAVKDAQSNAAANDIPNCDFVCGDVDRAIEAVEHADAVVIDPPRKGCAPATLDRVAALRPKRIVYVSCHPATLARDLARLAGHGYRVRDVEPVDMFPQTFHVEAVASLDWTG
ncbi:23S rRNA (uracil(1939)-C(5))-methyltransferase RlmD [candidate division WOR-3 bacterium]|nr:23S rRNA (uracil(1939)-C(5))-methyltransferase RlmD [candidate division WOR-3 bacterium]